MVRRNPAVGVGNLLKARYFQALTLFDGVHEVARLEQRLMGTGVKPRETTTKHFNGQRRRLPISS